MSSPFRLHVFVCQNERPSGSRPSCAGAPAEAGGQAAPGRGKAVLQALRRAVAADPALSGEVLVTASGCLGPCFHGPMLVVYPDAVWYQGVGAASVEADVKEIVESHFCGGRVVGRLRYEWEEVAP